MDKTKFAETAPGQLIHIQAPEPDWAFVPNPLPDPWPLPIQLVPLLVQARSALAKLDGAGQFVPEGARILIRPLQQREAIKSSSLEGTFATAEELLVYELEPKEPKSSTDPANAWREVFNYDKALQHGQSRLATLPISGRLIRELHETLLSGVRGADRTPGEFRTRQVHVGSDRRFIPPPPQEVPKLIADLEAYAHNESDVDPLVRAFLAHYQFETIHPFLDGNGRVGRLLLSLMIYGGCALGFPWLYLSAYFDRYKDEYIDRLFKVSAQGDWTGWVEFCLRATVAEATEATTRLKKMIEIRAAYEKNISANGWPARMSAIVNSLLGSPLTTAPRVAKLVNVTFPTAKKDIERLVSIGVLRPGPDSARPQYYYSSEFMDAAYQDIDR